MEAPTRRPPRRRDGRVRGHRPAVHDRGREDCSTSALSGSTSPRSRWSGPGARTSASAWNGRPLRRA